MINGIYHQCHTPVAVIGTLAQKEGMQIVQREMVRPTPFGNPAADVITNYTVIAPPKAGAQLVFMVPAMIQPGVGTSIQIVPFQDGAAAWPNITYSIDGSLDGVHFTALPTPIVGAAITSAAGPIHSLLFPLGVYRVRVTITAQAGLFAVITN